MKYIPLSAGGGEPWLLDMFHCHIGEVGVEVLFERSGWRVGAWSTGFELDAHFDRAQRWLGWVDVEVA